MKIPDRAMAFTETRMIGDTAVDGKATIRTNREGHGGPRREAHCRRSMNEGARLQIGMDSLCCDLSALE